MKIGVLTSGGDAPGMNAAIRAIVKSAIHNNVDIYGIKYGYKGILEENIVKLSNDDVDYIAELGGTILKTARCLEFLDEEFRKKAANILKKYKIEGLIAIGGDGSFKGAEGLGKLGINTIGLPGTIDNDLNYTDYCIGFDTTLNTVLDCIKKIKDTDNSHEKTTIVEVMGRYCGDLALYSAMAGGAEIISTPEQQLSFENICKRLGDNIQKGKKDNIVIITERMYNIDNLKYYLEENLNINVRTTILGFIQRGGSPSAYDRILASKMGIKAVQLLMRGVSGKAIGIRNNEIISVDFNEVNIQCDSKQKDYDLLDIYIN